MPKLESWSVVGGLDPYQPPECQVKYLEGKIFDDELGRFPDGSEVTTSRIVKLDLSNMTAQTRNTEYILGKMSDGYTEWLKFNKIELSDCGI